MSFADLLQKRSNEPSVPSVPSLDASGEQHNLLMTNACTPCSPRSPHKSSKGHAAIIEFKKSVKPLLAEIAITAEGVAEQLSYDDISDWTNGDLPDQALKAIARSIVQRREMERGVVPASYDQKAHCKGCGPVWLWEKGEFVGCPWCWNRAAGKPVPNPNSCSEPIDAPSSQRRPLS